VQGSESNTINVNTYDLGRAYSLSATVKL